MRRTVFIGKRRIDADLALSEKQFIRRNIFEFVSFGKIAIFIKKTFDRGLQSAVGIDRNSLRIRPFKGNKLIFLLKIPGVNHICVFGGVIRVRFVAEKDLAPFMCLAAPIHLVFVFLKNDGADSAGFGIKINLKNSIFHVFTSVYSEYGLAISPL